MRSENLDRHIDRRMAEARTPGMVVALTDRERTLRFATYGMADREMPAPVTPDTLFEIGSVSKTFTAVTVLQAVEGGLLALCVLHAIAHGGTVSIDSGEQLVIARLSPSSQSWLCR